MARLENLGKLLAIAISPRTRIQTHKQASKPRLHKASSLRMPALANCCRVVSLARRTRRPSDVI